MNANNPDVRGARGQLRLSLALSLVQHHLIKFVSYPGRLSLQPFAKQLWLEFRQSTVHAHARHQHGHSSCEWSSSAADSEDAVTDARPSQSRFDENRLEGLLPIHDRHGPLHRHLLGERTSGLVFSSRTGKPLHPSNPLRRIIHPLLEKKGLPLGGNHIFRRFRLTWLRENSVPSDIERFWFGHANRSVGDDYSMLKKNVKLRKEIADRIGVGFKLPESILAPVVPNVPKIALKPEQEILA